MKLPAFADIRDAADRLKGVAVETPLIRNVLLDEMTGRPVYVKCEPLQLTGSFKIRGAYNRLCRFTDEEKKRGAVAFSSGNHAQGISRAAKLLEIPATIVMPTDTPAVKIEGVRRDGAEIVFYDRFTESREAIAADISARTGAIIVPSFNDFHVIAGQGSCGLEITRQWPEDTPPSALICNVGGGGLIAGITLAVREVWPDLAIWGVEPEGFDDHALSLKAGQIVGHDPASRSICDALLSDKPGTMTFAINQPNLSGIGLVSDEQVREAVRYCVKHLKITAEPGGAASLAALLAGRIDLPDKGPVLVVLTGGNVDPAGLADILKD